MTAPYRKKLIDVSLPLARINEKAAREKSIRHGHPSTLHLWWARRPLAACRAVLLILAASAKRHRVAPWDYVKDLLTQLPSRPHGADLSDQVPDA